METNAPQARMRVGVEAPSEPGRPDEGIDEAWTLTAALAASTEHARLGQLVTCVSFRHPGVQRLTSMDPIARFARRSTV